MFFIEVCCYYDNKGKDYREPCSFSFWLCCKSTISHVYVIMQAVNAKRMQKSFEGCGGHGGKLHLARFGDGDGSSSVRSAMFIVTTTPEARPSSGGAA